MKANIKCTGYYIENNPQSTRLKVTLLMRTVQWQLYIRLVLPALCMYQYMYLSHRNAALLIPGVIIKLTSSVAEREPELLPYRNKNRN
jgi:hypothetical protein